MPWSNVCGRTLRVYSTSPLLCIIVDTDVETAEVQPHTAALLRAQRWTLGIAAFCVPVSEGGAEIALLLTLGLMGLTRVFSKAGDPPCSLSAFGHGQRFFLARADPLLRALIVAVIFYLGFGLMAAFISGIPIHASQLKKILYILLLPIGMLALPRDARNFRELRMLFICLSAGFALALCAGLSQYFTGWFVGERLLHHPTPGVWPGQLYIPGTGDKAATGTLRNRIKMSEMLVFGMAAALSAFRVSSGKWTRLAIALGTAMLLVHLTLTHAKTALLAVAVGSGGWFLLLRWPWLRSRLGTVLAAGLLLPVSTVVFLGARLLPLTEKTGTDALSSRMWAWKHAVQLFIDHPVWGTGIGTYTAAARPLFENPQETLAINAHNQHLTPLAEGGVVGFVCWLAIMMVLGLLLRRAWQWKGLSPLMQVRRDLATLFLFFSLILSWVHDVLYHPVMAGLVWISVGILCAPDVPESCEDLESE